MMFSGLSNYHTNNRYHQSGELKRADLRLLERAGVSPEHARARTFDSSATICIRGCAQLFGRQLAPFGAPIRIHFYRNGFHML